MPWIEMNGKQKPYLFMVYRVRTTSASGSGPKVYLTVDKYNSKTNTYQNIVSREVAHTDSTPYYNDDNFKFYYPNYTWGVELKKKYHYASFDGEVHDPQTISWQWSTSIDYKFYVEVKS